MSSGRRDYWRAVALVFSGTAVAQMIPLLGSLVIARLFLPAEFGIFMAWLGIAALAGIFVTARFEMALALEEDGRPRAEAASATFLTTILLLILIALIGGICVAFFGRSISRGSKATCLALHSCRWGVGFGSNLAGMGSC
jgi:O-antigen/teichoic acid export membrane protein